MPLIRSRHSRRSRPHLGLVLFTMLAALSLGCDERPNSLTVGAGNTGVGGDGGGGGGQGGYGGAASTSTTTSTTIASTGVGGAGGAGGDGGAGGEAPQPATFAVAVDKPDAAVDLRDKVEITASIVPNGYVGAVTITFGAAGSGVTGELDKTMVTLDGATTAKVKLTLTTLSSTPPGAGGFSVSASVETGTKTAVGTLTVLSDITVVIPKNANQLAGTGANPNKLAFGDYPIVITAPGGISDQKPVTVRFFNDDTVPHEIHGNKAANGFPHDPGPIAPGTMDELVRKVNATGSYDFYLHDQGGALTIGRIVIQ